MIRRLPIFDLFRHGHAEFALPNDSVLIAASAPDVFAAQQEQRDRSINRPRIRCQWTVTAGEGNRPELRMFWTIDRQGGR